MERAKKTPAANGQDAQRAHPVGARLEEKGQLIELCCVYILALAPKVLRGPSPNEVPEQRCSLGLFRE